MDTQDDSLLLDEENERESEDDFDEEDDDMKVRRYDFNSFRTERSIRDLRQWAERGRIIIPDFQRSFVWDYSQSSLFIESILLGLPIPDLFIFRDIDAVEKTERFVLIDGLQRFTTILQFTKGEFISGEKSRRFSIANKQSDWAGKTYADLSEDDKVFFDDYSLKFTVFDSVANDDRSKRLYMTEIFRRINTGSSKLSDQEIRNAVYAGPAIDALRRVEKTRSFADLVAGEKRYIVRFGGQELALRILAYAQVTRMIRDGEEYLFQGFDSKVNSSKSVTLGDYLFYCNKGKKCTCRSLSRKPA